MKHSTSQLFAGALFTAAGAAAALPLMRTETSAPAAVVVAQEQQEAAPETRARSSSSITIVNAGGDRLVVKIVDGEMDAMVNGESVPEERIQREDGVVRILDEAGETLFSFREGAGGGGRGGRALVFGGADTDFDAIERQMDEMRRRLFEGFGGRGFVFPERLFDMEGAFGPLRLQLRDMEEEMTRLRENPFAGGARGMGTGLADVARRDLAPEVEAAAKRVVAMFGDELSQASEAAIERAASDLLDRGGVSVTDGRVGFAVNGRFIHRTLTARVASALERSGADIGEEETAALRRAVSVLAQSLSTIDAELSEESKQAIEEMRDRTRMRRAWPEWFMPFVLPEPGEGEEPPQKKNTKPARRGIVA